MYVLQYIRKQNCGGESSWKAEKIYDTGTYSLHHDYVFDDDGNLLVLATDTESDSVEDQIIQINTQTGEVSCVLDLGELFSDYKEECTENEDGELDWIHINTIQWIGDDAVLLASQRDFDYFDDRRYL